MKDQPEKKTASAQLLKTDGGQTKSNAIEVPSISLPKGGGALKGIDEKFQVNAVNGTASFSIPLPLSPNRNGFTPQMSLSYNSGVGNGLFGIGWDLDLPAIQRRTDKKLPRYFDSNDVETASKEDSFMFSGVEELVPYLDLKSGQWEIRQETIGDFTVRQYRPRIEGGFSRIERIWHKDHGYYWRVTSKENITTFFGYSESCRIADPAESTHVFQWLPEFSFDDKGSWVWYEYKAEDLTGVTNDIQEKNRFNGNAPFANKHLKRIKYGNQTPYYIDEKNPYQAQLPINTAHFFELVLDYGEHDALAPKPNDSGDWISRKDPFSSYRACFEMRTYRLCQRVLMYHTFPDLNGGMATLVRSIDLDYALSNDQQAASDRPTELTYLVGITQKGYVWRNNGYASKALPTMTFDYQWLSWNTEVKTVSAENLVQAPTGLSGNYQWTDLYNEGINGILTEQANGWFYKSNLGEDDHGNARFSPAQQVMPKPSFTGLSNSVLQLQDLEANGEKQLVVTSAGLQGYFEFDDAGAWQPFKSFLKTLNLDLRDPNVRMLDVNGDGKPEVVLSDLGAFWWWENEGKIGYDSPELATKPYDEEQGASIVFSDQEQRIFLADMSGDGLTDIVRIRNGEVCYWANMGYGRFSAKVTMGNSPVFDQPELFNPAYLQLADISGTGATDIVYLGKNKFKSYLNFSGNAWSDVTEIDPFFSTEQPNKVTVTDLLGHGTACIVWSSEMPAYSHAPMRYIDLMGGKKPHIMRSHENGFGKKTEVEYKSSTWFYLQDKLNGTPWITKLPFPVQVVTKTIITESVTNVRFAAEYSYHHGYYDHAEREFRGFGRVDQKDTEYFDVFAQTDASNTVPAEHHQPPVLSRTWFHTGAYLDKTRILTQFKKEYWYEAFKQKGYSTQAIEFELPDAVLLAADNLTGLNINELSAVEWREALRACKGMTLRQEIFGLDAEKRIADEKQAKRYADQDPPFLQFQADARQTEQVPYSVATHNCEIQLLQAREQNKYGVFIVKESEAITYAYERNPEDPRIAHTLNIETDEYGNVLEAVSVVYPRLKDEDILKDAANDTPAIRKAKEAGRKGQKKQWVTLTQNSVSNDIITPENYYLRKVWQTKTYELTGLKPAKSLFSVAEFKGLLSTLPEIQYFEKSTDATPQKRLVEHVKTKFYDAGLTGPLPDGQQAIRGIPFEAYQLAYTPNLIDDIFAPSSFSTQFEVNDADMLAGRFLQDNTNWWIQSGTVQHRRAGENFSDVQNRFFAPVAYTDPFDSVTEVFYDPLNLFMQRSVDAVGNESQVLRFNYRSLSPDIMRDMNDNISSVIVDELGLVKAAAVEGKAGNNALQGEEGDKLLGFTEYTEGQEAQNILDFFNTANTAAPQICNYSALQQIARDLLGQASARMVYDFSKQPTVVASIAREKHAAQDVLNISPLQISFEYSDGLGKVAMKKVQAEPGLVRLPDGTDLDTGNQLRWVGNGRTVLNNKGNPIRQFEPYFSTTPAYENDPDWVEQGVSPTIYYDGAGRNVKTELPNGTFTKVIFDAWKQYQFDVNDTVKDSAWYQQRMALANNNPEKKAAQKTEIHYDTPSCIVTDTLGRPTLGIDHNRWEDAQSNLKEEFYYTTSELDVEGNALSVTDARGNVVMSWRYDMLGHQVMQTSMDAGKRWMLNNALGNPVKTWDERQHEFSYQYDALHRPTKKYVIGGDGQTPLNHCYELIQYGENQPNDKLLNLRGKPAVLYDTAGKVRTEILDFKGNLIQSKRTFAKDYKNTPHWDVVNPDALLEGTAYTFTTSQTYDALNRIVTQTTPDGKTSMAVYNPAGYLEKEILNVGTTTTEYVKNVAYDAKGQRTKIQYGNGTSTKYDYDPLTFRLNNLRTTAGTNVLQDLAYTYDPTGNIIQIKDDAIPVVFFNNQKVQGKNAYEYDAMYRLITAEGREQNINSPNFDSIDNWNDAAAIFSHGSGDPMKMRAYTQRYQYDSVGNILQMRHEAGANGSWTRDYNYESKSNRLKTIALGGNTYQYPHHAQHGYMVAMPHLQSMAWTFKEELQATARQSVNTGIPETTYYIYDGSGQRARKITENAAVGSNTPTVKDERIYVSNFELYRNENGLERETLIVMTGKERIAMLDTETQSPTGFWANLGILFSGQAVVITVRYQMGNHMGSVSLELDENAAVISYEEYHPYGTTAYQARNAAMKAVAKRYRYTGMERDEETGLEYHSARFYVGWLGRWLSADPIGIEDGGNMYRYCNDNPVSGIDLKGTQVSLLNNPIDEKKGACSDETCTPMPTPDYGSSKQAELNLVFVPESSKWSWIGRGDIGNDQRGLGMFNVNDTWFEYDAEKKWYYDEKGNAYYEGSYSEGIGETYNPTWEGADKSFQDFKWWVIELTGDRGPEKAILDPISDWWEKCGSDGDYWTGYWDLTSYQKGRVDGKSWTGVVQGLPTMAMTYGFGGYLKGMALSSGITVANIDMGLANMLTTSDGFLIGSMEFRSPLGFNAQRFGGQMKVGIGLDYWGLKLGNSSFVGRQLNAIWPHWNDLSIYTSGYVPKGTMIGFGIIGPQSFRYGLFGGTPQFLIRSSEVLKQSTTIH